jgi:hypothetical protein
MLGAVASAITGVQGSPGLLAQESPVPQKLSVERLDDRLILRINDRTFTVYRFGAGQKYPYFFPVNGPASGLSLTTESSLPYPHHRSLFFGCDKVNGGNYWQEGNEKGQILSRGPQVLKNGPGEILFLDECDWRQPGKAPMLTDRREIRITAPSQDLRLIDFQVTLKAREAVQIEKTNHSLFAVRMAPELSAKETGTMLNAAGDSAERGTFGTASPWMDCSGQHCQTTEGIAIFDSPGNPWYPSRWFTRDYGFFSPTPFEWLDEKGFPLKMGETLALKYRVVVHNGNARQAGIARWFEEWERECRKNPHGHDTVNFQPGK